jgi:hypothetical protein
VPSYKAAAAVRAEYARTDSRFQFIRACSVAVMLALAVPPADFAIAAQISCRTAPARQFP